MASKKFVNAGKNAMVSGRFGEAYVSYLLVKRRIVDVVPANTAGFDLFAIDKKGKTFTKNKIVGISVRTRMHQSRFPLSSKKLARAAKTWGIEPWIAVVSRHYSAILAPLKNAKKLRGRFKINRHRKKDSDSVSIPLLKEYKSTIILSEPKETRTKN